MKRSFIAPLPSGMHRIQIRPQPTSRPSSCHSYLAHCSRPFSTLPPPGLAATPHKASSTNPSPTPPSVTSCTIKTRHSQMEVSKHGSSSSGRHSSSSLPLDFRPLLASSSYTSLSTSYPHTQPPKSRGFRRCLSSRLSSSLFTLVFCLISTVRAICSEQGPRATS